ncbi:MAG: hypothetical protein ACRCYZ_06085 [Alphaproteobacteria bacterium]
MSLRTKKKATADILDLDFYRRFRVILPLNPQTLSKRFALSFLKGTDPKKQYALKRRSRKKQVQTADS